VAPQGEPGRPEALLPAKFGADAGCVGEQAVLLLLPGQPGKFLAERVIGVQECFLAVQDGWLALCA
jgi:hypothetical protein